MVSLALTSNSINPLDDHLGYQLRRASSLVMTLLAERLATIELTIVETSVLVLINRNPGIFQSEIGRILGIKRANVAPLVATLERRNLLCRTPSEGRLVGLSTTPRGKEVSTNAETIMQDNDEQLFGTMTINARRSIRAALETIWRTATPPSD